MPPRVRHVFAALAPFVVGGAAWWALDARTAAPEAGPVARQFDEVLAGAKPAVVVLGASFANADFDRGELGKALGKGARSVEILAVPAAAAPVWYAMLKERVYARGMRPELVILPISTPASLVTRLLPAQAARLDDQMPVYDEVVMRRSFDSRVPVTAQRLLDRRASLRDPILEAFRNALPGLVLGADGATVSAAGTAVFGEQHAGPGARLLPVVEAASAVRDAAAVSTTNPGDSYLEDIADLVQEHGGRLAFVLPPVSPTASVARHVDPAVELALVEWANARRVAWVDLRDLGWAPTRFKDGVHMHQRDAREFTTLVAARLLEIGATSPEGFRPATPPMVVASVTRRGTPPALPTLTPAPGKEPCAVKLKLPGFEALGAARTMRVAAGVESPLVVYEGEQRLRWGAPAPGCSGTWRHTVDLVVHRSAAEGPALRVDWAGADEVEQGTWVLPGTELVWSFDGRSGPAANVAVEVLAIGGEGGTPELRVADQAVPLRPRGPRLHGEAEQAQVAAPWEAVIRSPRDGPYLLLRRLQLSAGGVTTSLVDTPHRELDVVTPRGWVVDGPLPEFGAAELRGAGDRRWFEVPRVGQCAPFRVRQGDTLLPADPQPSSPSSEPAASTTVLAGTRLYLPTSLRDTPAEAFAVALSADRRCAPNLPKGGDGYVWLYAGNTMTLEVPRAKRHGLGGDTRRVLLSGTPLPGDTAASLLTVVVRLDDTVLAQAQLTAQELGAGGIVELPRPVAAAEAGALRVEAAWSTPAPPLLLRVQIADSGA